MVEKVEIGDATLFCGDCRDVLPTLGKADAVVTDPPYGIGEAAGANISRSKPFGSSSKKVIAARDYGNDHWDNAPIDQELMAQVTAAGRWNIIFGGNYYAMPPTPCWLVWDKLNTGDFADCELAWTNMKKAVRRIQYRWNGMLRQNNEPRGDHPTQKPVGVMRWCIGHLPADAETIIDPFMGSGTTGVACIQLGRKFIGIERERKYFDIACERITKEHAQPRFELVQRAPAPEQMTML